MLGVLFREAPAGDPALRLRVGRMLVERLEQVTAPGEVAALALGLFTVFHPRWRGAVVEVDVADLDAIEAANARLKAPRRGRRPSP